MKHHATKILTIFLVLALAFNPGCQCKSFGSTSNTNLAVYFLDVGQGDSILIDLGPTEILIDGGERQSGVVEFLKQYVQGDLEVVIATHPHADHIGGLIEVLNVFKVDQVWYNGESSSSKTYADFMDAVQTENAQVNIGKSGDKITAGNLTMTVLNPFDLSGSTNNNSIVAELDYGNLEVLFEGDAEKEAEARMLGASDILLDKVLVLKVGHHASRTASSPAFLARTMPDVAVYSAATGNSYGHPHQETIDALKNIGSDIYGTDVNGTITVTTDGNTYRVIKAK
jgi:competence protein ComEC